MAWVPLVLYAATAAGQSDDAALALADRTEQAVATETICRGYVEGAVNQTTLPGGRAARDGGRLSLDLRCDPALGRQWRTVLADRVDGVWQREASGQAVDTLKEAYLSGQYDVAKLIDVGRINVRQGVALGYNPTDYFRGGAIRQIVSPDPVSLRENRLGSVMLRAQTLWSAGSLTAIYSPRFGARPNDSTFNPDFGATNGSGRWLLAWSETFASDLKPQGLLFGAEHQSPQVGFNLTRLVGNATVAYAEWSGGRSVTDAAAAFRVRENAFSGGAAEAAIESPTAFRSRLATGLSYSTAAKFSFSLEYEYNGAALDHAGWAGLRAGSPADYARYRNFVAAAQDLPTRQNLFGYAGWSDAFVTHLDLTSFVRLDLDDRSRMLWAEARYHGPRAELAIQWQRNAGDRTSNFGAGQPRQLWQFVVTRYL
jgi:hypothetical protein